MNSTSWIRLKREQWKYLQENVFDTWQFVWEIMKKSRVWNDFLKNMCSKHITLVSECVKRPLLNFAQKLDLFGDTLFFYPVANTFSQTGCQIPFAFSDWVKNHNIGTNLTSNKRWRHSLEHHIASHSIVFSILTFQSCLNFYRPRSIRLSICRSGLLRILSWGAMGVHLDLAWLGLYDQVIGQRPRSYSSKVCFVQNFYTIQHVHAAKWSILAGSEITEKDYLPVGNVTQLFIFPPHFLPFRPEKLH